MFEIFRKEIMWGGRRLILETGKVARQADGAVMATYGETTVLCTAVASRSAKPGQDFFPLTVNYQEKTFAAGKIPGGFFKREGRPSEKETLVSRLIDRPIRPLFAPGFLNETQVVCTVLSHDLENDPDIVALVGASAALTLSGIPFYGPIGGARVAALTGKLAACAVLDDFKIAVSGVARAAMRREVARLRRFQRGLARAFAWPATAIHDLDDVVMVCRCEGITAGELRASVRAEFGPTEVNRLKAVTRCGMGRCSADS